MSKAASDCGRTEDENDRQWMGNGRQWNPGVSEHKQSCHIGGVLSTKPYRVGHYQLYRYYLS